MLTELDSVGLGLCKAIHYLLESRGSCDKLKRTGTEVPPGDGIPGHGCFANSTFPFLDT